MQSPIPMLVATIALVSCSSTDAKKDAIPGRPANVKVVAATVKGNHYIANRVGTHSVFSNDSTIEWLEPLPGQEFEKKFVEEVKTLDLNFISDTAVTVKYGGKVSNGTYKVDDITGEDDKAGIKLRISYVDEQFKFGDGPASPVTFTYLVEGMDENKLLLETPRSINRRKAVVLMNKQ
jgi:hypothetical protein